MKTILFAIAFGGLSTLLFFVLIDTWKLLPSGWLSSLLGNTDFCMRLGIFILFTAGSYAFLKLGRDNE